MNFRTPAIEYTVGERLIMRIRKRRAVDAFVDPGNAAHRWGTLKNKVPEEEVGGLISGPRKSSTPLGIAKTRGSPSCLPRPALAAFPPTLPDQPAILALFSPPSVPLLPFLPFLPGFPGLLVWTGTAARNATLGTGLVERDSSWPRTRLAGCQNATGGTRLAGLERDSRRQNATGRT